MNPSPLFCAIMPAPFGAVGIRTSAEYLQELVYLPPGTDLQPPTCDLSSEVERQLNSYFAHPEFQFSLPLAPQGTKFQHQVWNAIREIPLGQVRTYGHIAQQINSAARAVGQACGANWFPLIIPCHRVTAAHGIGGFAHHADAAGFHLNVKRWLLAHESVHGYSC